MGRCERGVVEEARAAGMARAAAEAAVQAEVEVRAVAEPQMRAQLQHLEMGVEAREAAEAQLQDALEATAGSWSRGASRREL